MNVTWTEWEKRVIGEVMNVWRSGRREWVREGDWWRGWSAKWSMSDGVGEKGDWVGLGLVKRVSDRRSERCDDGVGEEGEREVRWSVRGRGWWSVWQRQWVREWLVNFKNNLFETESQRLGFQIWNRVSETRFPRFQPRHNQRSTWKPRKNRVLNTRFSRGVHLDLLPRQG